MGFFQARSDLRFAIQFRADVHELWKHEAAAASAGAGDYAILPAERRQAIQAAASRDAAYRVVREKVARGQLHAIRLARVFGVPCDFTSFPAPAIGGPIVSVNLFQAILYDGSHGGISRQAIEDAMIQLEGVADERVAREKRRMLNPLNWVKEVLVFVIRIPFMLVEASGFDVGKVEDHFLAKLFKLIEIVVIAYVLYRLDLTTAGFRELLLKVVGKGGAA